MKRDKQPMTMIDNRVPTEKIEGGTSIGTTKDPERTAR